MKLLKLDFVILIELILGEVCDDRRAFYECGFGYRKCMADRCYGYLKGENCINSADCNPHSYCDPTIKTCLKALLPGAACASDDQCDMGYVCKFDSSQATAGKCTQYFSLATQTRKQSLMTLSFSCSCVRNAAL